ncbi:MAG: hypothetical protein J6U10_02340 [Lachnospiraceae bacterium]|nr:hypothetical protein [Lachnospiraceae bacterium]MBP5184912.1 hypothetical protein [Lachnospiraceae bacterium]
MGLFHKREETPGSDFEWMTVGEALTMERMKSGDMSFTEILERCEECCEQYADAKESLNEIKNEIARIDERIGDVCALDTFSENQRFAIEDITKQLVMLIEERTRFMENEKERISPSDYLKMERNADAIPDSLQTLKEQDDLRRAAMNDMSILEREKDRLEDESEQLAGKKVFFKNITIAVIVILVAIFGVLTYLTVNGRDFALAFVVTAVLGMGFIVLILLSMQKNKIDQKTVKNKINRAVKLTNTTKIKYVNSTNTIDFICEKYDVNGYDRLEYLWNTYLAVKAEREKFAKSADLIDSLSDSLGNMLKGYGIAEPELMVCTPSCILDKRERVEMRHRLNERRRAIKDRLDFAQARFDSTASELMRLRAQFPDRKNEFDNLCRSYGLKELVG